LNKVSVIIPTYNSAPVLKRAVESALNQTESPREIIVIDDGSDDDTAEFVRALGDKIVFLQQTNQGQGAARNRGLEIASGEYIAFLDADDYWKPQFIEKMTCYMDNNPDAIAASCGFHIKRGTNDYTGPSNLDELKSLHPDGLLLDDFFGFWAEYDHIRTGTVLIRKAIIDKAGRQNPDLRISQDLEYWGLLGTWGQWGIYPEILWIGDSHGFARAQGWRKKYMKRRRLCPSVEAWQARILPRLEEKQVEAFNSVRGRVASGYALNKLLGGDSKGAFNIVRQYGKEMPNNKVVLLMRTGARFGRISWILTSMLIKSREYAKR